MGAVQIPFKNWKLTCVWFSRPLQKGLLCDYDGLVNVQEGSIRIFIDYGTGKKSIEKVTEICTAHFPPIYSDQLIIADLAETFASRDNLHQFKKKIFVIKNIILHLILKNLFKAFFC